MTGIELVVGYLAAWGVRKLRRVGARADAEVDRVLDAALDELHEVVTDKLGGDPALARLEAAPDAVTERVGRRVEDAVADAAEDDQAFAAALTRAITAVRAAEQAAGATAAGTSITAAGPRSVAAQHIDGIVATGDGAHIQR